MNTTDTFSLSRFGWVLKRDLTENWKLNLLRFVGLYALITMVLIVNLWWISKLKVNPTPDSTFFFNTFYSNLMTFLILLYFFIGYYCASTIMETMKNKAGRTTFLTLPTTMSEKFLARFLIVTVGFSIAFILAVLLMEMTYHLILPLFDVPKDFNQILIFSDKMWLFSDMEGTTSHSSYWGDNHYSIWLAQLLTITELAWIGSLFMIGGVYWKKKSLLKTLCLLVVITIVGFNQLLALYFRWRLRYDLNIIISVSILTFLILFNWWLSYRIFKRSQVVKPKFGLL